MKKYKYLFIIILIIFILFVSYIKPNVESFDINVRNLTLDEFNNIFQSEMVNLPENLFAFGYNDNIFYYHARNRLYLDKGQEKSFLSYWLNYIHININKSKYYFVCASDDGYGERVPYSNSELIPYTPKLMEFIDKKELPITNHEKIPILHKNKYVFCFAKRINDKYSLAVPDFFFTDCKGYIKEKCGGHRENILPRIDENFIDFDVKISKCIFRSNLINGTVTNFFNPNDKDNLNQRQFLKRKIDSENLNDLIDYNDNELTPIEQLQHKYILDVDGWSNAWDGLIWKLYSGSLVIKVKSVWKQWYYDDLQEYVHYVPVNNDFSDLKEIIQWCIKNDEKCKEIIKNSREFVKTKLEFDYVTKHFTEKVVQYI
jgi:hypothetical protein